MAMSTNTSLAGRTVLVTRPTARATGLAARISAVGGQARLYPVMEIAAPTDGRSRAAALENLASFDMAIFISPTAVEQTLAAVDALPAALSLAALGSSSARVLRAHGYTPLINAPTQDSESLLLQPPLQAAHVGGKRIVIFRGEGGRELLADTLRRRGALVCYADMYQRRRTVLAPLDTAYLQQLDAVCVSSNQGLENLLALCADYSALKSLPLFVPSQRCAVLANSLGFRHIHVAHDATDDATLRALISWAGTR